MIVRQSTKTNMEHVRHRRWFCHGENELIDDQKYGPLKSEFSLFSV